MNAPPRLSGSARLVIDAVCTRFEAAWQAGARPRLEAALADIEPDLRPELSFELLAVEIELRSQAGETPRADDYLGRFPEPLVTRAFAQSHLDAGDAATHDIATGSPDDTDRSLSLVARDLVPRQLPGYAVRGVLGQGGMGVVVRAWDEKLHRDVAIKLLPSSFAADEQRRQRFLREARACAAIRHPHVVGIHAVADDHDPPFLVLEFVDGVSLAEHLTHERQLPIDEVVRLAAEIAAGLAAAHARGIVHRDVKPGNVLLERDGRARLTDFGLARGSDPDGLTSTGLIVGTPQFMSPEQIEGRPVDARSDLFSLGALLYRMLTGRCAFTGDSAIALARQICDQPPRPITELRPDVPAWLAGIVDRLLAKRPEERIGSADELLRLLRERDAAGPSSRRTASRVGLVAGIALVLVVALVGRALVPVPTSQPEQPEPVGQPRSISQLDPTSPPGRAAVLVERPVWQYVGGTEPEPAPNGPANKQGLMLALSADGRSLFVGSSHHVGGHFFTLFAVDPETGSLTDRVTRPCERESRELIGSLAFASNTGGRFLYTFAASQVRTYERDDRTGAYSHRQTLPTAGDSLSAHLLLTHDGRFVFCVSGNSVTTWARDTATGLLTPQRERIVPRVGKFQQARLAANHRLYANFGAAENNDGGLLVATWDDATGELTETELRLSDGARDFPAMVHASGLSVAPDARHLYVSDPSGYHTFAIAPETGGLSHLSTTEQPLGFGSQFLQPDDQHVFLSGTDGLRVFSRDAESGRLTLEQFLARAETARGQATHMVLSPDGRFLYSVAAVGMRAVRIETFGRQADR